MEQEDSSTAAGFRDIRDTATQPSLGGTDNERLLCQPFINNSNQPSEQLLGEVLPQEQDEVVTPIPATGDTSESQSYSSAESLLVRSKESGPVDKDWVLSKIQKVKEDSKQERDKLSQQVEELKVVVKKLQEELKKQTDLIQELRQHNHIPATQSDPDPISPTEYKFSFLSGEAHPPNPQHDRTIRFVPS